MGSGLAGWRWLSQHLVASLKHCQSQVQDLPFAEILAAAIKAVVGFVCVSAIQLFQLSLCLLLGCAMKVLSLSCLVFVGVTPERLGWPAWKGIGNRFYGQQC